MNTGTFTISMQGIAELAQVARPAVSQWRTRFPQDHATPFPAPLPSDKEALLFDGIEVAEWLVATNHGHNTEAVEDAPFYSELFNSVADNAATWAALTHHARTGEEVTLANTNEEHVAAVHAANSLAAAAYSPQRVLDRMSLVNWAASPEALQNGARVLFASLAAELLRAQELVCPAPEIVSFGPGGDGLIAAATKLTKNARLALTNHNCHAYAAAARGHDLCPDAEDFSPSAVVIGQWVSAQDADAAEFFSELDDLLLNLDPTGVALVIAPAELLIHSHDEEVNVLRKNFLWSTKSKLNTSLRYSALLPHGWVSRLGRRQLALWALRPRQYSSTTPGLMVLADHSQLDPESSDAQQLTRDVLAALDPEVPAQAHPYLHGTLLSEDRVRMWDSLRPTPAVPAAAPATATMSDLRQSAVELGVPLFDHANLVQAGDPYQRHSKKLVPWPTASTGTSKLVRLLSGSKLTSLNTANPDGTVRVVGANEMLGLPTSTPRQADRFEIEFTLTNATITEPGDVLFLPNPKVVAVVDYNGGQLVEAPVQVLRCKEFIGRSKQPLEQVAIPSLLAREITRSGSKDKNSWLVPVLPAQDAAAFQRAEQEILAARRQLTEKLEQLQQLECDLGDAMVSGTIRGAPG